MRERILAYLDERESLADRGGDRRGRRDQAEDRPERAGRDGQGDPASARVPGTGVKNDPRQYRTLAPHFDGFGADDAQEMIPPDPPSYRGQRRGESFSGAEGEAGNDRYTR